MPSIYVYDLFGNLVCLDGRHIVMRATKDYESQYDCQVIVTGFGEHVEYMLHEGMLPECRDYLTVLGKALGAFSIEASSTPRPEQEEVVVVARKRAPTVIPVSGEDEEDIPF